MGSHFDHLIVGSGFSGSLLARILAKQGRHVLMVERSRHPRFALGESSTPLANIALERMARNWDLPELDRLAAHGRWVESYPGVRCGLKRGFSFYLHQPGRRWSAGAERRLLVAASPNDEVADVQWLRSDVDRLLARLAVADGADLWEETVVERIEPVPGAWRLSLLRSGEPRDVTAASVVDASGAAAAVATRLGATRCATGAVASDLLYAHFRGVRLLGEAEPGQRLEGAPYPEDWAAVHHLLEEGWMYLLRFDDGLTSAGLLFAGGGRVTPSLDAAEAAWWRVIERYPTLASLFTEASPVRPIAARRGIQHRLSRAAGRRWIATPHTYAFVDPLFSVGIAWSLRGVERLADLLLSAPAEQGSAEATLCRYESLLAAEASQVERLVAPAYRARRRLELFAAHAMLYFAWVSHAESRERLVRPRRPWWDGFLGAGEAAFEGLIDESARRLDAVVAGDADAESYQRWITAAIEPLNVAGLADLRRDNLYPADPALLVAGAAKLGLEPAAVEAALPRLLGGG